MRLDHIAIVAPDCACLRDFFVDIAGMEQGARPPFGVGGYWLYLHGQPMIHLIERPPMPGYAHAGLPSTRIDHLALRIDSAAEWQALLLRLRQQRIPYQLSEMRAQRQQQLFVMPVPDITVEFVIDAGHLG